MIRLSQATTIMNIRKVLTRRNSSSLVKIAVEGCCHGELDAIYDHVSALEAQTRRKIDFLLICGDFQAVRNHQDLQCMSVPEKYRKLGGFCK
jgi:lariat debranching enzyme